MAATNELLQFYDIRNARQPYHTQKHGLDRLDQFARPLKLEDQISPDYLPKLYLNDRAIGFSDLGVVLIDFDPTLPRI